MTLSHFQALDWRSKLTSLFILLFFASYFHEAYNLTSALLLISALSCLFIERKTTNTTAGNQNRLLTVTLGLFTINLVVLVLSAYLDLETRSVVKSLEYPVKAVLLCLVGYAIIYSRVPTSALCYGLIIGSVLGAAIAGYDSYIRGVRGFEDLMPIQKGNAAILYSSMLLTFALYFFKRRKGLAVACLLGANLALAASLLSLTRGGWILAPLTYLVAAIVFYRHCGLRFILLATCSLLITALVVFNTSSVEDRIAQAVNQATESERSVGVRLEMWQSAWKLFLERPILGWGQDALQPRLDIEVANGALSEYARSFNGNAHSAYFNALSQRGIFGFLGLFAFLAGPGIIYLMTLLRTSNSETKLWATLGGLHILSTAGFCVSQDHFLHNEGVVLYATTNAILLGYMLRTLKATETKKVSLQ